MNMIEKPKSTWKQDLVKNLPLAVLVALIVSAMGYFVNQEVAKHDVTATTTNNRILIDKVFEKVDTLTNTVDKFIKHHDGKFIIEHEALRQNLRNEFDYKLERQNYITDKAVESMNKVQDERKEQSDENFKNVMDAINKLNKKIDDIDNKLGKTGYYNNKINFDSIFENAMRLQVNNCLYYE